MHLAFKVEYRLIPFYVPIGPASDQGDTKYLSALATDPTNRGLANSQPGLDLLARAQPKQTIKGG